ncbi:hypothetical protein [Amycolatopsis sp. FDAARGOS 1241]|uniref:hypothetical protein n=1 Tax=Amycolatopsis sp. FDAARGOS 1241 TaxID=2778070 RepID=UPI0019511555|nr:hypothetical protein [Amycolatopsis sp. FDAARGOS 1241]QRP50342.1 hypothetical protein I6J71_23225 [Amycolatopsis sp. FDAARGOS 1241]
MCPDLPELAQYYFVQRRRALLATLADYLSRRIRSRALRAVPDLPAAARFVVETIAWFAWHRAGDPDIYLCRQPHGDWSQLWPALRHVD